MASKVLGYEDKNYNKNKMIYDLLVQVFQDVKYGKINSAKAWSTKAEDIKGCTMRLVGESSLEFTFHRYDVNTVVGLNQNLDIGLKFIDEIAKLIKEQFKKETGKSLVLEKVSDKDSPAQIEKHGRIYADVSSLWSGKSERPIARYLVRNSRLYNFSADL